MLAKVLDEFSTHETSKSRSHSTSDLPRSANGPISAGLYVRDGVGEHRIESPPVPASFVWNIGELLDSLTGGL